MCKQYKIYTVLVLSLVTSAGLTGQDFLYKAGFYGFFDNREYFNNYVNDQTIFGTRVSGELGYAINNNNRFMVGADYLYEFGSKGDWIAPDFIAYFHTRHNKFGLYMGAFPRLDKINMPMALMTDTFQYFRPNVEGILIEYNSPGFYHNIWIDWSGRQSIDRQEKFLLGFSANAGKGLFIYSHHFVMTHLAHSMNENREEHIRDNGALTVMPGLNLTGLMPLDSLTISAGVLVSYDRLRGIYNFRLPVGFLGEINALYRRFGIQGTIYAGESQYITSGDGFYKSTFYCRTDAFYQVTGNNIKGKVQLSAHFVPGVVDLSMSLVIRAYLDGAFKHHQSN
jgi:hypothetical protein